MLLGYSETIRCLDEWRSLYSGGISLTRSLELLADGAYSPIARARLTALRRSLSDGGSLSEHSSLLGELFGSSVSALLIAGERAGALEKSLLSSKRLLESLNALRLALLAALAYPALIGTAALLLLPLPAIFSDGLWAAIWRYYLPAGIMIAFLIGLLLAVRRGLNAAASQRRRWENRLFALPFICNLMRTYAGFLFFSSLRVLIDSGLSLDGACGSACAATGMQCFDDSAASMEKRIGKGEPLSAVLSGFRYLPGDAARDISLSEETGTLPKACETLCERYDKELRWKVLAFAALVGVLALALVVVVVVGYIVGFWTSYFDKIGRMT